LDVCLDEEEEVSVDDLNITGEDNPDQRMPFRLKLFRELMGAAPGFEFYSIRRLLLDERRYNALFGAAPNA
jgi:hypothetical protein